MPKEILIETKDRRRNRRYFHVQVETDEAGKPTQPGKLINILTEEEAKRIKKNDQTTKED